MIKITIFQCTLIYTGGGERIVLGQLNGLKKRGYQVEAFAPVIDKKRCYPDLIKHYPVASLLPQLPNWFPLRHAILLLLTSFLAPILVLRFRDTDLFIGENQPGAWLAYVASRVLGKPYIIYTCHPNKMLYPRHMTREQIWKNQTDFYWLSIFFEPFKPLLRWLDKISFTGSRNHVLINGNFVGREFERIYKKRWIFCPSGAPFIKERRQVIANNKVYEGEITIDGIKIKKPYLLYVGRHEVWKRIDLVIKAFVKIVKKQPNLSLVVRGPFSQHTDYLRKLASSLGLTGKVIFSPEQGNQDELKQLYFNALAFVFPSQKEDFGIVIIEAMGAGVPAVAWNSAGPTDIIINGKTGYLTKPFDLDDFCQKTLKIVRNRKLRHQMSLASWKRVRDHFSWKKHLDVLEKAIKEAINPPSANRRKRSD